MLEVRQTADGTWRAAYAFEGEEEIRGWVTAITKDRVENLMPRFGFFAADIVKNAFKGGKAATVRGAGGQVGDGSSHRGQADRAKGSGPGGRAAEEARAARDLVHLNFKEKQAREAEKEAQKVADEKKAFA